MKLTTPLRLLIASSLVLSASTAARAQDVTRTVTTQTDTAPGPLGDDAVTKTVTTRTSDSGSRDNVTKTVTTQTDQAPAGDVTRTVTTRTDQAPAGDVTRTVTTRTDQVPAGDVTRTVTTKTSFSNPRLPHRGLFQIEGSATFFWVDDFGIRHYVRDPDAVRALHLPNEPVYVVNKHDIRRLPTGRALTVNRGPQYYLTQRDETAVLLEKPRVIVEFGTGPNLKRVQLHDLKDLKAVEDFDDLEDLTSAFLE